jgi:hypothetical protein
MHVLSSRSRFAGVGLERRATTPYAPIEGGGMSAARKYTRAGTRRGAGAAVGAGGTAVGRGAAVVADLGAGGTAVGRTTLGGGVGRATLGAGGTGVGRLERKVGRATLGAGGAGVGRTTLGGGFGAPIGAFRCAKHLFLRASQAGSAPRLMHSPRA